MGLSHIPHHEFSLLGARNPEIINYDIFEITNHKLNLSGQFMGLMQFPMVLSIQSHKKSALGSEIKNPSKITIIGKKFHPRIS